MTSDIPCTMTERNPTNILLYEISIISSPSTKVYENLAKASRSIRSVAVGCHVLDDNVTVRRRATVARRYSTQTALWTRSGLFIPTLLEPQITNTPCGSHIVSRSKWKRGLHSAQDILHARSIQIHTYIYYEHWV